jgi:hypothetical protein
MNVANPGTRAARPGRCRRIACAIAMAALVTAALPAHATAKTLGQRTRDLAWLRSVPPAVQSKTREIRLAFGRRLAAAKPGTSRDRLRARLVWLPLLLASPSVYRTAYLGAVEALRQDSRRLKRWIQANPDQAVVEVAIIGGGIHGLGLAYALSQPQEEQEALSVLVIDAGDIPAQNLALLGEMVRRNSANRATGTEVPKQQGGDRNPGLGLITTPDVAGGLYPPISKEAELAALNALLGGVPLLLDTRVSAEPEKIGGTTPSPLGQAGGFRIRATDGTTVYARQVVVTTGLRPVFAGFPQETVEMLQQIYRSFDIRNPDARDPAISVYPQSLVAANLGKEGRTPYRASRQTYRPDPVEGLTLRDAAPADLAEAGSFLTNLGGEASSLGRFSPADVVALRPGPGDTIEIVFQSGAVQRAARLRLVRQGGVFEVRRGDTLREVFLRAGLADLARPVQLPAPRKLRLRRARDVVRATLFPLQLIQEVTTEFPLEGQLVLTGRSGSEEMTIADAVDLYFEPSLGQWVLSRANGIELALSDLAVLPVGSGPSVPLDAGDPLYRRTAAELAQEATSIPEIAIIGRGDGARTLLEFLFGLLDESAYTGLGHSDVASLGRIGAINLRNLVSRVTWIVGEDGIKSCEEALQTFRSRYLGLIGTLRENETTGLPTVRLVAKRVLDLRKTASGRVEIDIGTVAGGVEGTIITDRAEVAIGVEPAAATVLGLSVRDLMNLPAVMAELFGLGQRAIARRTPDGVLVTGSGTGIVDADETFLTGENKDSLYAYTPRLAALADLLRSLFRGQPAQRVTGSMAFDAILERRRAEPAQVGGNPAVRLPVPPPSGAFVRLPRDPVDDELILRTQLARVAETLDWSQFVAAGIPIVLSLTPTGGSTGGLELGATTLSLDTLRALLDEMTASDLLLDVLQPLARRRQALEVRVVPESRRRDGKPGVKGIELLVRQPGTPAVSSVRPAAPAAAPTTAQRAPGPPEAEESGLLKRLRRLLSSGEDR